jgi:hypothetical protein
MVLGRGDCLAKSALLLELFHRAGYSTRRIRWLYLLPDQPAEVRHLPSGGVGREHRYHPRL